MRCLSIRHAEKVYGHSVLLPGGFRKMKAPGRPKLLYSIHLALVCTHFTRLSPHPIRKQTHILETPGVKG